ncbi:hypothetical protein CNY89_24760, partial [Amaricoccus sp. HAR-UPW-R2A-40]
NDPGRTSGGRPRKADKREIVEAILYFLRAGCACGSCRTTSHLGRRSTTTCAVGSEKASGQACSTPSSWPTGSRRAGKPRPRRRSSTAKASGRPIKRGLQRL